MFKKFSISLMTVFTTLFFVSASQAMVIQNKSDATFNVTSANYAELCHGTSICPDKQKHCLAISGCQDGCITLTSANGGYMQTIKAGANDKVVIKGKNGNYKVIRHMSEGNKEIIKFTCCPGGCAVQ